MWFLSDCASDTGTQERPYVYYPYLSHLRTQSTVSRCASSQVNLGESKEMQQAAASVSEAARPKGLASSSFETARPTGSASQSLKRGWKGQRRQSWKWPGLCRRKNRPMVCFERPS